MTYIHDSGIISLGTIRSNRILNNQLSNKKIMKKKDCGLIAERISSYKSSPKTITAWKGNKIITLLLEYAGAEPKTTIQRFDRWNKIRVDIKCPFIAKEYNRFMGGVDLLDSLIDKYKRSFVNENGIIDYGIILLVFLL